MSKQAAPATTSVELTLQQALTDHRAGRLQEAERLNRVILQGQPNHADANHNLGLLAMQRKQPALALPHLKVALQANPAQTQYWVSYIEALMHMGQIEAARQMLAQGRGRGLQGAAVEALAARLDGHKAGEGPTRAEIDQVGALSNQGRYVELEALARDLTARFPLHGLGWKMLGVVLNQFGISDEALVPMQKAVALLPGDPEVHYNLGIMLKELGRLSEAEVSYRRALELQPDFAEVHGNLGLTLQAQGRLPEAEASYRRVLELQADYVEAHNNLGNALLDQGRLSEGEARLRRALELKPNYVEAHNNLGNALRDQGRLPEAEASLRRALELKPDFAEAHNNLGATLKDQGRLAEAEVSCRRALEIKPDYAEAHYNLGIALQVLGRLDDAVASYRRALEIKPDFAEAHSNLGHVLGDLGQLVDAVASYRRALEIKPDFAAAHSNLLFCLSHNATVDAETLFAEHCRFAEQFEAPLRANWPQHTNSRNPDRCLQVGFVSADLRTHAVAHFIEPVLAHLAGYPQLSLHAYYNHAVEDDVTQRLRGYLSHWHAIAGLSDAALAQKVREDGIDILIDLSGHTAKNRLLTFARKAAPIQITWIGYPNTTGLRAMDYVLKDRFNAPYGAYERYYVEKLARLPSSGTFLPAEGAPPVNDLPALSTGSVTFGSFNRSSKLGDGVIALWSQVLRAVPGSRLLLGPVGEGSLRANLIKRFARCGVMADRLTFQPRMEMSAYLALHHQVDFILDTFPYSGGTTTHHALWMGVPVLALTGPSTMRFQSAGALRRAGLTDWVAGDAEDFVLRAVGWAGRLDELARLRAGMRDRLLSSPLRQPEAVARGLEGALRVMWRRWCEGLPAESFEVTLEDLGMDIPIGIARCGDQ